MNYELYYGNKNKSFLVFSNLKLTKDEMIAEGRAHFHSKASDLICESGYIEDDDLYISNTYKSGTTVVWVVHRK